MFGIGPQEIIILMVVALIVFGPQKLPEIGMQVGKAIRDFRRMSDEMTGEFSRTMTLDPPPSATPEPQSAVGRELQNARAAHSNGASGEALAPQVIPSDHPGGDIAAEEPWTPPASDDTATPAPASAATAPVATKADPLAGVSLLDEAPVPPTATAAAAGMAGGDSGTVAEGEAVTYRPAPAADVAATVAPAGVATGNGTHEFELDKERAAVQALATPAAPAGEYDSAAAWEAVATTEATAPLAVAADTTGEAMVEPGAGQTIGEKVGAEVAADAFRERRRRARYSGARKRE